MDSRPRANREHYCSEHAAETSYFDRNLDIEAVKILPGECFATTNDVVIVTVLGTCVAACVRDRELGVGGMNHFMLGAAGADEPEAMMTRNGTDAMDVLIERLLQLGARRDQLEAKVFGGAAMPGIGAASAAELSAEFVQTYLRRAQIAIVASDLHGSHARKVYYFPRSGRALVRRILRLHNDTLAHREADYAMKIQASSGCGDVQRPS